MRTIRHHDPKIERLRALDLFRNCTGDELRLVARMSTETPIGMGDRLCRQGEIGRQAFVIIDGEAVVDVDGTVVGVLGAGAVAGEIALLDHGPRVATVTAVTPMTVLALNPAEFAYLLRAAPTAARRLLVHMGGRLRQADRALAGATG